MTRLKKERLMQEMTQAELAEKSGISRQTIILLEQNGEKPCNIATMVKIAQALGKTVDEIFLPVV